MKVSNRVKVHVVKSENFPKLIKNQSRVKMSSDFSFCSREEPNHVAILDPSLIINCQLQCSHSLEEEGAEEREQFTERKNIK
jgi:hypothetical protein